MVRCIHGYRGQPGQFGCAVNIYNGYLQVMAHIASKLECTDLSVRKAVEISECTAPIV